MAEEFTRPGGGEDQSLWLATTSARVRLSEAEALAQVNVNMKCSLTSWVRPSWSTISPCGSGFPGVSAKTSAILHPEQVRDNAKDRI